MICFVYNEVKYLSHTIKYYQDNGCEIYVIDNFSTDGTWEWLQENRIPSHRVNTNESFDLRILQREIIKTLPRLKPDWVIYAGADLYYIAWTQLKDYIEKVESMGYNQLSMTCWSAFNTGEKHGTPLPSRYFYAAPWKPIVMISKYNETYDMNGDNVMIAGSRIYEARHAMAINYGACKPANEQEIKLQRRKKAWAEGMRPQQGVHFLKGKKRGWIRSKMELKDLRKVPEYKYIQKIVFPMEVDESKFKKESYDEMYQDSVMYKKHYKDTFYYPVWEYIAGRLSPGRKVLDLGCGPGQLAHLLSDLGFKKYEGIDFSSTAISMARKRVPLFTFTESDLFEVDFRKFKKYQIISTETFEHLKSDIDLIRKLPKGRIIFSIPNYMCSNHYRTYNSEAQIKDYYKDVLDISDVKPFSIGGNRIIFVVEADII